MPPAKRRLPVSTAAPLFLLLLIVSYIGCFMLGRSLTGGVIGGIVTALAAPCLLLVLGALLLPARFRVDHQDPH